MTLSAQVRDGLRAIVGDAGWVEHTKDFAAYETPARYGRGRAAAVLRPANTSEVSQVAALMVREGVRFVTQAAHTGLVLGATPDESGDEIVLSVDRLRAPPVVDAFDRTVDVGAGIRLSELNAALAPHGLNLPIDLGADPMIGGMVAANTGGARFLRYGGMRRHVLAVEAVLANETGEIISWSSGLRKDNSRLAIGELFVGSCGRFGIITRVKLEARVLPQQSAVALLVPRDDAAVLELLAVLEREVGDYLTAFEAMSGDAMQCALAHVPNLRNPFNGDPPPLALLVELSASSRERAGAVKLETLLGELWAELFEAGLIQDAFADRGGEFWKLRHSLSEGMRKQGEILGFDLAFKRGDVFTFRRAAHAMLRVEFNGVRICDFGHVGDGGLHFNLLLDGAWSAARKAELSARVLDLAVHDYGASFSGEHGLGRLNRGAYAAYTPPRVQAYAAAIRDVFASPAAHIGRQS